MSLPQLDLPRSERAEQARALRERGWTHQRIADAMGISRSYASALCTDPDGSADRARKRNYGRDCAKCGKRTNGSNGRENAPELCASCYTEAIRAPHGTRSRYNAGCGCDECREANRLYSASLKGKEPPNHGTASGYNNYGCRCDACREAWRDHRERWAKKVRGTEPPRHGYSTAYNAYGCRCDECRGWNAAQTAKYRKRVAA